MECKSCQNKQYLFLPCPQNEEPHKECVHCMYKRFATLSNFCKEVIEKGLHQALESVPIHDRNYISTITCDQINLTSIHDLKNVFAEHYVRPEGEKRHKNLLRLQLKCACYSDCNYDGMAIEKQDHSFLWQTFANHSCEERSLQKDWDEVDKFKSLVTIIEKLIPRGTIDQVNTWSTDYKDLSQIYKREQDAVHQLEDEAIKEVWGLPCPWRRARGEMNKEPSTQDVNTLKEVVQKLGLLDESLCDYINNDFYIPQRSYFQQRGYFIILMCSSLDTLQCIFEARAKVMCYARNLLDKNMFLLCYRRLNTTVLRNHVWMVGFILQVIEKRKQKKALPLMGKTTVPLDSASENLYVELEKLFIDIQSNL